MMRAPDPITATVLAVDAGGDHLVFVSCDLVSISDDLCSAPAEQGCLVTLDTNVFVPALRGDEPYSQGGRGTLGEVREDFILGGAREPSRMDVA